MTVPECEGDGVGIAQLFQSMCVSVSAWPHRVGIQ